MKSYAMSKLSASFVVLVMALSALVVILPSENSGQTTSGMNIYVPVASGGTPVTSAVVNLTDMHTGAVTAAIYSAARTSYVASSRLRACTGSTSALRTTSTSPARPWSTSTVQGT